MKEYIYIYNWVINAGKLISGPPMVSSNNLDVKRTEICLANFRLPGGRMKFNLYIIGV